MTTARQRPVKARLGVVFVQHDRAKYPNSLQRLIQIVDRLTDLETAYVVVDNALPGDWQHAVAHNLTHLGGDNHSWEFSAFERGCDWLNEQHPARDLFLFATDALLAYGDEYLDLVDDRAVDTSLGLQACVGWMDSFMQPCSILGYDYRTWIRTSLFLVPAHVLASIDPMALELDEHRLFDDSLERPFHRKAPISSNLQQLLLQWLLRDAPAQHDLEGVWHSQFRLSEDTVSLFRNKVKAILREHLLSARLLAADIPCFDLRALRQAEEQGVPRTTLGTHDGREAWAWLHWMQAPEGQDGDGAAPTVPADVAQQYEVVHDVPTFVTLGESPQQDERSPVAFFADEVLPLVRQRHPQATLLILDDDPAADGHARHDASGVVVGFARGEHARALASASALLLPSTGSTTDTPLLREAIAQGVPIIGSDLALEGHAAMADEHYLFAEADWQFAHACCRLIEDPRVGEALGSRATALLGER